MIWLDFFLQVFVHALAWCLAIMVVIVGAVAMLRVVLCGRCPARPRRAVK